MKLIIPEFQDFWCRKFRNHSLCIGCIGRQDWECWVGMPVSVDKKQLLDFSADLKNDGTDWK